mmetsp:Transcript_20/g.26  ORF Transcript_20/g.26 Transcript_20/m.26 type:complete len:194 (-) Transcript_20:61-642(-)|eukprot:CAMPEP_0194247294 /NCGR_PEP_ID=MMETSP0158-20130606/16336_1 /TAXON_ID=33649 /ORGANISM="Thalassionema nitzschioides, Strain L26-B" /LENGTH=193 /DNA_ID=CAMNT_0038983363 /DNA_START=99 /DNA_END=680 /DNA_ORIENTATION=+
MGRRKRDDNDDTLEREYFQRRFQETIEPNDDESPTQTNEPISERPKKKSRKQRHKEKKAARLQEEIAHKKKADQLQEGKAKDPLRKFTDMRKGVKFSDIIIGKGPQVRDRKKVRVRYKLRAKSKVGKILDSNENFGFRLGKGEVIQGWDVGLEGMRQGGVRHLIVPPGAGYGRKDVGAGSGADLYFEVTLLSC